MYLELGEEAEGSAVELPLNVARGAEVVVLVLQQREGPLTTLPLTGGACGSGKLG